MSNPDGVLDAIDACLKDSLSPDAMRWAPDEPDPTPADGHSGPPIPAPLADLSVSLHADVTAFADGMRRAVEAVAVFGKVMAPALTAARDAFHTLAYGGDRKHSRHCPTCNPRGFPKPLPINGHEYNRRRRRRVRK